MFVATKASVLKGISADTFESVTFHSKTKRKDKSNSNEKKDDVDEKSNIKEIGDMKKLRYEIIKFGTSGFSGSQKEDANVALLVSLGAEAPKKKAKNYKEILTERKIEKQKDVHDDKYKFSFMKKGAANSKMKKNGKKDFKGLLNVYGEVKNKNRKPVKRKKKKNDK